MRESDSNSGRVESPQLRASEMDREIDREMDREMDGDRMSLDIVTL